MAKIKLEARTLWEFQWYVNAIVEDAINQVKAKEIRAWK